MSNGGNCSSGGGTAQHSTAQHSTLNQGSARFLAGCFANVTAGPDDAGRRIGARGEPVGW